MTSLSKLINLSNLEKFLDISRGPSFKDLMNAAFFDSEQLLEFRFKDDRPAIIGMLAGYVPGGGQFCLIALNHYAGRSGAAELAYFFYNSHRRLGKRIYPKSLKQLFDYGEDEEQREVKLDDLARWADQLAQTLRPEHRWPDMAVWRSGFRGMVTEMYEKGLEFLDSHPLK
ncbi:MAG: hypothetical protein V4436_01935 [Patescibacteria group bacterium]